MIYFLSGVGVIILILVIYMVFIRENYTVAIVLEGKYSTTYVDDANVVANMLYEHEKYLTSLYARLNSNDCNAVKSVLQKSLYNLIDIIDQNPAVSYNTTGREQAIRLKMQIINEELEKGQSAFDVSIPAGFMTKIEDQDDQDDQDNGGKYTSTKLLAILIIHLKILIKMLKNNLCHVAKIKTYLLQQIASVLQSACVKKTNEGFKSSVEVVDVPADSVEPYHLRKSADYSKRGSPRSPKNTYTKEYTDSSLIAENNQAWGGGKTTTYTTQSNMPYTESYTVSMLNSNNSTYTNRAKSTDLFDGSLEGLTEQDILNGNNLGESVGNIVDATSNYTTVVNSCGGKVVTGDLSSCVRRDTRLLDALVEGSGLF